MVRAIVLIDLDNFKAVVEKMGWSEYTPNPITSLLTTLTKSLVSRKFATVIYGLNEERGTEEVLLEFTDIDEKDLLKEVECIRQAIEREGIRTGSHATVSIGVVIVKGERPVSFNKDVLRRRRKDPLIQMCQKVIRSAKRHGGNRVEVLWL